MPQSEVRRLMEQIGLATQAIERAMNEPAIVANHDAIIARYTNLGKVKDELAEHIGNKAATEAVEQNISFALHLDFSEGVKLSGKAIFTVLILSITIRMLR